MNRRHVVFGLTTPLLAYGFPPLEFPTEPVPEEKIEVVIAWQNWPFNAKQPDEWVKGRCSSERFTKMLYHDLFPIHGEIYWRYVPKYVDHDEANLAISSVV